MNCRCLIVGFEMTHLETQKKKTLDNNVIYVSNARNHAAVYSVNRDFAPRLSHGTTDTKEIQRGLMKSLKLKVSDIRKAAVALKAPLDVTSPVEPRLYSARV